MPMYDFICEVCGTQGREWRSEGCPPKYCNKECKNKGRAGKSFKKIKYVITPEIHEKIGRVYQEMTGNNEVNELAARIGYPRHKITRYAIQQGWLATQKKEPDWTEAELKILEHLSYLSPEGIQKRLKKAGYSRSVTGIVLKRKRMRFLQNLNGQSMTQLAECFGVDGKTVQRWLLKGWLQAKRRGTNRTELQGGDAWYIKEKDVKNFIIENPELIDLRKVDKFWFIDVVANGKN